MSDSLQPNELQPARLPCPSLSPRVCSNYFHQVDDTIQPSHPLSPSSPLALNLSQHQDLFQWVLCITLAKALELSAAVLPTNIQDWLSFIVHIFLRNVPLVSPIFLNGVIILFYRKSNNYTISIPEANFLLALWTACHL